MVSIHIHKVITGM